MLQSFLGSSQLRRGLSLYLNTYRFSNARTSDLWDAFTNVRVAQRAPCQLHRTFANGMLEAISL